MTKSVDRKITNAKTGMVLAESEWKSIRRRDRFIGTFLATLSVANAGITTALILMHRISSDGSTYLLGLAFLGGVTAFFEFNSSHEITKILRTSKEVSDTTIEKLE